MQQQGCCTTQLPDTQLEQFEEAARGGGIVLIVFCHSSSLFFRLGNIFAKHLPEKQQCTT